MIIIITNVFLVVLSLFQKYMEIGITANKIGDKIKFYTVGSGSAGSMFKSHAETAAILNTYLLKLR